jgi:uncharacterized membrane protein
MKIPPIRTLTRIVIGLLFAGLGLSHLVDPAPFVSIMPPYLPWHLELVYISGFFEILGGLGLLLAPTRRLAAWGLLALLIAVYPANIHMLVNEIYLDGMPQEKWLLWVRMPMQLVFAIGVLWVGEIWPRQPRVEAEEKAGD